MSKPPNRDERPKRDSGPGDKPEDERAKPPERKPKPQGEPDDLSTRHLVWRAQKNANTNSWTGLSQKIEKHLRKRYGRRRVFPLGNEIDDFVMEVMLRVLQELRSFAPRGPGSFWAWLQPVADRLLIDMMRREKTLKRGKGQTTSFARPDDTQRDLLDQVPDSRTPSPSSLALGEELASAEMACVSKLGATAREVYMLRRLHGLDFAEISRRMRGAPEGTLRKAFLRAKVEVQDCIRRRMDIVGDSVEGWEEDGDS